MPHGYGWNRYATRVFLSESMDEDVAHSERRDFSLKKILPVVATVTLLCSSPVMAQTATGPLRSVLALGRVQIVADAPISFMLSRVAIPAGSKTLYRGVDSLIYVVSGSVTVTIGNDRRSVGAEEGAYLPPGVEVAIQPSGATGAELLQYQLLRSAEISKRAMNAPASVTELHEMKIPHNSIRSGPHEFSLTRVTLPAGGPTPRPHTRSGAALYYVLSGGDITIWPSATPDALSGEPRTEPRGAGTLQEEPYGFIHSWSPKADAPLVLLQANISQEGIPEIIFVKQ
jgi:quercetin dioxygenase-like cupin family protein